MKKIIIILILSIFIFLGCENTRNTPTSKVENFLSRYQMIDSYILNELDSTLKRDSSMNKKQKTKYKKLMEKQYQNLSYKIEKEEIEENNATVDVEIEVLDYQTSINKAKKYFYQHPNEFKNKKSNDFVDYKIKELKKVTEKIKYDITFNLTKKNNIWLLDNISEIDYLKLHGLY